MIHEDTTVLRVTVNGRAHERAVAVRRLLVDVLRDDLGLTGTHIGCEQGICGACTVLIDGAPARSCTVLAVQAEGAEVTTVEGLEGPAVARLREAFHAHHALQCGYCTPGFLVTLSVADPDEHRGEPAIRELLAGNLCRCTGYQHIVDAVVAAWGPATA